MLAVMLIFVACVPRDAQGELPDALRRAVEYRQLLHTAMIELVVTEHRTGGETLFYTFRSAGDRVAMLHRGDGDGRVVRQLDNDGQPFVSALSFAPQHALLMEGQIWSANEAEFQARLSPPDGAIFDVYDLRNIALNPISCREGLEALAGRAKTHGVDLTYSSGREGNVETVSAKLGGATLRWWIDPERDWSVVRTEVIRSDGSVVQRSVELAQADGFWFPKRVADVRIADGGAEPICTYEILAAQFNRPEHPQMLDPAFIGVDSGMEVQVQGLPGEPIQYWDGEKLISSEEFQERVRAGTVTFGPKARRQVAQLKAANAQRLQREAAGLEPPSLTTAIENFRRYGTNRPGPGGLPPFESEWEAYTRAFIAKYKLDEDQTQKAWSICDECQARGKDFVRRRHAEITALDAEEAAVRAKPAEQRAAARRDLAERRAKLLEPVQRIFDEQLKPRLEKLPTRAQRAGADQPHPTSHPASERE